MAEDSDQLAYGLDPEKAAGPIGFLAEERGFDRHVLWRLGSWGFGAIGAVTIAVLANQSTAWRRDALAPADLARQSQQIKSSVENSQAETRRLSSAIETLNADRDRLYARVTSLEQGLDTVTGSISHQIRTPDPAPPAVLAPGAAATPSAPQESLPPSASASPIKSTDKPAADAKQPEPAPVAVAPVETVASSIASSVTATPAAKSTAGSFEAAALTGPDLKTASQPTSTDVVTSKTPASEATAIVPAPSNIAVQRTDFGVDLGGAGSLDGLRALWQGLKSNKALTSLRPVVMVKDNTVGPGVQLRLVAGPLSDAAAAAKVCAALNEPGRSCETAVFDGQRLAMKSGNPPVTARPVRKRPGLRKQQASSLSFFAR